MDTSLKYCAKYNVNINTEPSPAGFTPKPRACVLFNPRWSSCSFFFFWEGNHLESLGGGNESTFWWREAIFVG